MRQTLAFDVYGKLIDTSAVFNSLHDMMPNKTDSFMALWRQKQLEYSFRRGLMRQHTDFSVCTRDALNYCCEVFNVSVSDAQKKSLLEEYTTLPAFPDVTDCLTQCRCISIFFKTHVVSYT